MTEIPDRAHSPNSYSNFIIAYHNDVYLADYVENEGDPPNILTIPPDDGLNPMTEIPYQAHSPNSFSNFIIAYHNEVYLADQVENEGLLKFIKNNLSGISETDSSFFPRAVTDLNIEIEGLNQKERNSEVSSALSKQVKTDNLGPKTQEMDGHNLPPDVITSNSQQRSGPDGSPALCPPTAQGFVNASSLSETGELFAPVRTLTFSDVESSHVEDSYINTSRFVSTPDKKQTITRQADSYGTVENGRIEVDMMGPNHDRGGSSEGSRENSPAFRQLEGEDENKLLGSGAFKPTFHGIDQEFLDHFTGKTRSSTALVGDIFSPLGGHARPNEETDRHTPPQHSPAPNSPYAKRLANQGIILTRHLDEENDEIQFQMSPTHEKHSSQPFRTMSDSAVYGKHSAMMNAFQPIDKGQQHYMAHRHVPRNLNDYLEQVTDEQKEYLQMQGMDMNQRQGDGKEFRSDNYNQVTHNSDESPFDRQFTAISQEDFERRYLRRTQVSVKLPQPMYDTISGEVVNQESVRLEPAGVRTETHDYPADISTDGDMNAGMVTQVVTSNPKESHHKEAHHIYTSDNVDKMQAKESVNVKEDIIETTTDMLKSDYEVANMVPNSTERSDADSMNHQKDLFNSIPSQNSATKTLKENKDNSTSAATINSISSHANQAHQPNVSHSSSQPSSRLLQETISQRNKANQKYVSNVPVPVKQNSNQSKEFKKPVDYPIKQSINNPLFAAKKAAQSEAVSNSSKLKVADKQKGKSVSSESLNQRQFKVSQNAGRNILTQHQSQARVNNQATNPASSSMHVTSHRNQTMDGHADRHHNLSGQSLEDLREPRVVTQVQNTSPVQINKDHVGLGESVEVQGMEDVRQQLQNMLRLSTATMSQHERSQYEHSEIVAGFGVEYTGMPGAPMQQHPADLSWNMFRKPTENEVVENFPSFTSQFLADSGNVSRSDVSLHTENQRLREMCEKERYRRKHCEQYIQQLNVKILEMQQQLAVAVSTDKRKDLMIEQLDKQLALVVEGWRKRDAEKDELVGNLQQEKLEVENNLQKQQQMISQFEHDMSEAVEALRQEREKASVATGEMKEKIAETERAKSHAEELLSAEQEKCQLIEKECENLRESRDTMDKKLEQMQRRLHREQDEWFQREQELLQRIEEVGEKNAKILQMEKAKLEEQGKLAEEVVDQLQEANNTVKRLEMELEAAVREKESTKVEMGIMEAKFENAQRVLETDLQAQMEKQISEQIQDVQTRYEKMQDEMRDKHKVQILELSQRHNRETEKQLAVFREELAKKEDDFRKQLQELETRLLEYRNENSELKLAKQKLESTRLEILTKLQYGMQTQWNEALSLLAATPQRKQINNTLTTLEDEGNTTAASTSLSLSSINFNLPSRAPTNNPSDRQEPSLSRSEHQERQPTNQNTGLSKQNSGSSSLEKLPTNHNLQISSLEKQPANHNSGPSSLDTPPANENERFETVDSPTRDNAEVRRSLEGDNSVRVETAALSHMKDFQEYMNRLAETPEWISALTRQSQESDMQKPVPQDISLLLSTYLAQQPADFINQSKQETHQPHPDSSNQNISTISQMPHPHFNESSNQLPFSSYSNTSSHNETVRQTSSQGNQQHRDNPSHSRSITVDNHSVYNTIDSVTPPRELRQNPHQRSFSESQFTSNHGSGVIFGGMVQSSSPMYEDSGMSRAVAIRSPQQGDDPYLHDDNESVISSIAGGPRGGYFQGGQCFSPPTRQRRASLDDSTEDLNTHSNRLNDDYTDLSERMKKHESHQNDLQKYIQMLLNKPQTDSNGSKNDSLNGIQNESVLSQEGLDLNDTAQAAQLQKELDRIQELRERQEFSGKSPNKHSERSQADHSQVEEKQTKMHGPAEAKSNILNEDQLGEITRLLNAVKDQPTTGNQHIGQLLNVLKDVQKDRGQQQQNEMRKGKAGADKPRPVMSGTKRNIQFHPSKGIDGNKSLAENPKPVPKSAQSKKIERKIAGSATKGDKGAKAAAWK